MAYSKLRQGQTRKSDAYVDDKAAGATLESEAALLDDDLNSLRSQVNRIIGKTNWYDDPSNSLEDIGEGGGGEGDLSGPSSSTTHAIARFDDETGKVLDDSPVTLTDEADLIGISSTIFKDPHSQTTTGSAITIDWSLGSQQVLVLAHNVTVSFDPPAGSSHRGTILTLRVVQGSGPYTITWSGTSGPTPEITENNGESTVVQLMFDHPDYFFLTKPAGVPEVITFPSFTTPEIEVTDRPAHKRIDPTVDNYLTPSYHSLSFADDHILTIPIAPAPTAPSFGFDFIHWDANDLTEGDTDSVATWTSKQGNPLAATGTIVVAATGGPSGGKALVFDATANQFFGSTTPLPVLFTNRPGTILVRARWDADGSNTGCLFSGQTGAGWIFRCTTTPGCSISGATALAHATNPRDGTWHYLGGIFGALATNPAWSHLVVDSIINSGTTAVAPNAGLRVGNDNAPVEADRFKGRISDIYVWSGSLTPAQLHAFTGGGMTEPEPLDLPSFIDYAWEADDITDLDDEDAVTAWSPVKGGVSGGSVSGSLIWREAEASNGLPSLWFPASTARIDFDIGSVEMPATYIVVIDAETALTGAQGIFDFTTVRHHLWSNSNNLELFHSSSVDTGLDRTTGLHFLAAVFDGSSSFLRLDETKSSTVNPGSGTATGVLRLGQNNGGTFGMQSTHVHGLYVVRDALTDEQLDEMQAYCIDKWSTPA